MKCQALNDCTCGIPIDDDDKAGSGIDEHANSFVSACGIAHLVQVLEHDKMCKRGKITFFRDTIRYRVLHGISELKAPSDMKLSL